MKPKVAFICVHNSCRSQMAEALSKLLADDVFMAYSAGSELKNEINPDAVRHIQKRFSIDMTKTQHPKLMNELPDVDIVVTMGCYDACPSIPCKHREDWGLEDPTGQSDEFFNQTIDTIINKISNLKERIIAGQI